MEALLAAARKGLSPIGCRMFVTTFPCHYCARHLVGAGVVEVQYIEPYPKSRALKLHRDSITARITDEKTDSEYGKVCFRPFSGIAPRFYATAFSKDRDLKDKMEGTLQVGEAEWTDPYHLDRMSYTQLEALLVQGK